MTPNNVAELWLGMGYEPGDPELEQSFADLLVGSDCIQCGCCGKFFSDHQEDGQKDLICDGGNGDWVCNDCLDDQGLMADHRHIETAADFL